MTHGREEALVHHARALRHRRRRAVAGRLRERRTRTWCRPSPTLLDGLVFAPQRNAKLRADRALSRGDARSRPRLGLAALTGDLAFPHAKPALVRALVEGRVDPVLFALSYDYVGDLAETAALIWPARARRQRRPSLSRGGRDA